MYQPSFSAPPSARILARACALLVVATSLFVAACGGTSTTTNKTDCFTQSPELRFWMRDTVAVALRLPSDVTLADQDVSSAVLSAINPALERQRLGDLNSSGSTDQKASLLVRGTSDAVAFYTLPPPASSDVSALCDQRVINSVNTINGLLNPSSGRAEGSTVLTPLVVQVKESGTSNTVPVSILGASPDWIFTALPDSGFGRPSAPPRLLPGAFDSSMVQDLSTPTTALATGAPDGTGTTIVVLDTGYQLGSSHVAPMHCGSDDCAPAPQAITASSQIASALSSQSFLPFSELGGVMRESDMRVTTDSADPGVERANRPPSSLTPAAIP